MQDKQDRQGKTKQSKTRQTKTGQDSTRQGKTRQNEASQTIKTDIRNRTRQLARTRQTWQNRQDKVSKTDTRDKTSQDKTRQDKTKCRISQQNKHPDAIQLSVDFSICQKRISVPNILHTVLSCPTKQRC